MKGFVQAATASVLLTGTLCDPALAAISTGPGDLTDPISGELFLAVYDERLGLSYTRDLGLTVSPVFFDTQTLTVLPDAVYLNTFAGSNPADMRFSLVAINDALDVDMQLELLTTSNVGTLEYPVNPVAALDAIAANITQYVEAVNGAVSTSDVLENLSVAIFDSDSPGFYGNPNTFNGSLGSVVLFDTGAGIGEPLAMHIARYNLQEPEATQRRFANVWTLAVDGRLSYAPQILADLDNDGVADATDNCTFASNADQLDGDGDGFGNACDTDLSGDCVTNVIDLDLLRVEFFSTSPAADFNGDGRVNFVDLGLFRRGFGLPPGPSALAGCP